jgi:glycosyltransferase involved in cell wall biosynthesis
VGEVEPVDVVLPCLNEAGALPWVLLRMPEGFRPLVVDNGSADATADVARALQARVITEPRPGYGAAVHAGIEAAATDVVAVMDADASLDPLDLPALVAPVVDRRADLVVGRRVPRARGVWPWHARLGNMLVARRLRRELGVALHDIGAARVAGREALLALGITDRRFGYPLETLVRAAAADWRIVEVDVPYGARAAGTRSKVSGSVRGTARAVRDFRAVLR